MSWNISSYQFCFCLYEWYKISQIAFQNAVRATPSHYFILEVKIQTFFSIPNCLTNLITCFNFEYFLLLVSKCKTHLGSTFISSGTFCCFPPPNSHKLIRLMRDQSDFVCISPLWLQWITGRLVLLACASYTMVAPTTHFKMKACPNTLGASSPHTRKQCPCSLHPS